MIHCRFIGRYGKANPGEHQNALLGERVGTQTRMWEHVVVSGKPFEDTKEIEVAIRLNSQGLTMWIDEVRPLYWPTLQGSVPLVAGRFEQQLFLVDCASRDAGVAHAAHAHASSVR